MRGLPALLAAVSARGGGLRRGGRALGTACRRHHPHQRRRFHRHDEAAVAPAYVVVQPAVIPTAATVGTTLTYSVLLKNNGGTGSGMTVVITALGKRGADRRSRRPVWDRAAAPRRG